MPEVMPSEFVDSRLFQGRFPPLFVVADAEHHVIGCIISAVECAVFPTERKLL